MKRIVNTNDIFGYLTVLKEVDKDKSGHRQYLVRCRCGKGFTIRKGALFHSGCKCKDCATREYHNRVISRIVGSVVNGFEILSEHGKNRQGAIVYECRCLKCGSIVFRTGGALFVRKGGGCELCKPNYHFRTYGDVAVGTLSNGSEFIIDAHDIGSVSQLSWTDQQGYVVCSSCGKSYGIKLHQFVLGLPKNSKLIVDHKNRNRRDCRTSNLRIVTEQQNSMNRSIQKNNTSGYVGVTSFKRGDRYTARIGLNYKMITVYISTDPVECAQAYNYASELLFKEFAGHRNDVPEARDEIKAEVYRRCLPFIGMSDLATTPVVIIKSA